MMAIVLTLLVTFERDDEIGVVHPVHRALVDGCVDDDVAEGEKERIIAGELTRQLRRAARAVHRLLVDVGNRHSFDRVSREVVLDDIRPVADHHEYLFDTRLPHAIQLVSQHRTIAERQHGLRAIVGEILHPRAASGGQRNGFLELHLVEAIVSAACEHFVFGGPPLIRSNHGGVFPFGD